MLKLDTPHNKNYCATVTQLSKFSELAGCDFVKAAPAEAEDGAAA